MFFLIQRLRQSSEYETTGIKLHTKCPSYLFDSSLNVNESHFSQMRQLLEKVEIWWIKEFEIPTNPDYDNVEIRDEDIKSGTVLGLDYVISVAFHRD
jgi:hypothetical protein